MKPLMINDIFPPVDVPDNSLYLFISLFFAGVFVLGFGVYRYYKTYRSKSLNREEKYLKILKECDFKDAKRSAYLISYYGRALAKTEAQKEQIEMIITELCAYKYKKDVPQISEPHLKQFRRFIDGLKGTSKNPARISEGI